MTKAKEEPPVKKGGSKYDSKSIETLRFPENVRRNPAMYIGGTDAHGLFVILRELCDNFVDEYLAGRNAMGGIKIDKDGSFWVQDSGAGIPQGTKVFELEVNGKVVKSKMPTMQAVFGELHTSGKFQSDAYKVSIGSHGVGVKGTNATSEFMDVVTCYKGEWFKVGFKKGKLTTPVQPCAAPYSPFVGARMKSGTLVHFKPDASIFSVKSFPPSMLTEWSEIQSYLNPGLKILVDAKGKVKTFFSKEGPKELIAQRIKTLDAASEPDMFEFSNELLTAIVAFSNADGMEVRGYTNGLANSQGGKHVDSVVGALFAALKPFMGRAAFTARDFADGMVGVVNAKLHKASFSSQDKAKLVDDRVATPEFKKVLEAAAKKFFTGNKALTKRLVDRAAKINELKTKFKASKAVATALNQAKKGGLPPNYAPAARGTPVEKRELFIVEGESAAGGFRQVRMPHQALLPLTGKIMNVARAKAEKALLSKAIISILAAIGFDPKAQDPMKKLQVGKIVLLSDADPDGSHINCLEHALFARYLPEMYDRGMIYVADMPEFYAIKDDRIFVGDTLSEVQAKLKKAGVRADVNHAKGWGEVDPEVLKVLAVGGGRRLIQINPLTPNDLKVFGDLMGAVDEGEASSEEAAPAAEPKTRVVLATKTVPAEKAVKRKAAA